MSLYPNSLCDDLFLTLMLYQLTADMTAWSAITVTRMRSHIWWLNWMK